MPHKKAKKSARVSATADRGYDNAPTATDGFTKKAWVEAPIPDGPIMGAGVLAPQEAAKKRRLAKKPQNKVDSFGGRSDLGGLSKNMHRILNAGKLREEYHAKQKAKKEEADPSNKKGKGKATTELKPMPYESLSNFNRRVESSLRPGVETAIRGAKAAGHKAFLDAKAKKAEKSAINKAIAGGATPEEAKATVAADLAAAAAAKGTNGKGKGKAAQEEAPAPSTSKRPTKEAVDPYIPKPKARATEFAAASQKRPISDLALAPPSLKKAKRGLEADTSMHLPIAMSRVPLSEDIKRVMEMERNKAVRMYRELKEKRDKEGLDA